MNLLTLDPGNITGWAVFKNKTLVVAGTVKKSEAFTLVRQPGGLPSWLPSDLVKSGFTELVAIEMPRWYPHDHSDVNDLLDLSVYVGELKRFYEAQGCVVELVWPRTWKGNLPKKITNNRTLAALSPGEVELLPRRPRAKDFDNNMMDAIGLGLWKLGRLR